MKRLRILCVIICIVSLFLYGGYRFYLFRTTDQTGPVIEMENNQIIVNIASGKEALLEGVTAYDAKDGDVTDSIVIESVSKFLGDNKKIVTYAAFDSNGHVGKATRKVVYADYISPTFSSKEPFRFPVNTTQFTTNVSVEDCIDGDISDKVKVSPGYSIMTDTPGDYKFQIQVANSSGDVEYLPITVEIYDPTNVALTPEIELKKYITYTTTGNKIDPKDYLKGVKIGAAMYKMTSGAGDYSDETSTIGGKLSYKKVKIDDSKVDYDKAGTYEITYSMTVDKKYEGKSRLVVVVRDKAEE